MGSCNELSDFDFKYLQNNKDFWTILHKRNKPRKKSALSIYQNKPAFTKFNSSVEWLF